MASPRPVPTRRAQGPLAPLLAVGAVLGAGVLALVLVLRWTGEDTGAERGAGTEPTDAADARDFLADYVDDDGRVVRTDQGGDTVSEGQAYAMLLAVDADDHARFDRIWSWTREELMRDDGLLSWQWADGAVVDPEPAADADLDAARALLLAEERWGDTAYGGDASALADAILTHETARTADGLVLLAGPWALEGEPEGPWVFNPSYVSPVATTMLAEATGDERWEEVTAGSRAAVAALSAEGLPPDWALVDAEGDVEATGSPSGEHPTRWSYDAARTQLRHAESCDPADVELAAAAADQLGDEPAVAAHDLDGVPTDSTASPLASVAQAAAWASAGDEGAAFEAVRRAEEQRRAAPSYYGDAWAALGQALLTDPELGGCPPLAD